MTKLSTDRAPSNGSANLQQQIPQQRWQIFPAQVSQAIHLANSTQLSPLLAQVLINRGIQTPEQAGLFLEPETQTLPSPLEEFPDLPVSLELLMAAIVQGQKIAICGDYDADGMTSTALLMRALRYLDANANYAIPSRMQEGYGINTRIIEDFHAEGVGLILTVDNGIAAYEPIARARELGLTVIITDHHDLPDKLPPANAILNPKLLPLSSPYRGAAGVGVAYILAICLAQALGKTQDLTAPLLELFTLGTIADLAPLTGVNRRWVRRGLKLLPKSRIPGIQALIEVAGLGQEQKALKPEAIGFRLGPRINAVGRIADPQIVIEMLTTEDLDIALTRAVQCEEANTLRRQMCEIIEAQAVEWCEEQQQTGQLDLKKERVLVVVQPDWHHGVIGIVASRLVERYGVPVFIGTYEDKAKKEIRGSARSIPEFNIFEALQACDDLLGKYGGHRAAGGFSFQSKKLRQIKTRLSKFACQHLQPEYLKPLVMVDVEANLTDIDLNLYEQIDRLHPCGIENADPVLWTANATIQEQRIIGKDKKHLKLTLSHTHPVTHQVASIKAIAWRWAEYHPLPRNLDIAYKIRLNEWRGEQTVELELTGVRLPKTTAPELTESPVLPTDTPSPKDVIQPSPIANGAAPSSRPSTLNSTSPTLLKGFPPASPASPASPLIHAEFFYGKRRYVSTIEHHHSVRQIKIHNSEGHILWVKLAERQGILNLPDGTSTAIDLSEVHYFNLLRAGLNALELKQKTTLLIKKDELLAEKNSQIEKLIQQVNLLESKITQLSQENQTQFQTLKTELDQQENAIQNQESHIAKLQIQINHQQTPLPDNEEIKHLVRQELGDSVWFCLQGQSQKDLVAAYKNYGIIQSEGADPHIVDYSEAGIRLGLAVEREVMQPFFQDLYAFMLTQSAPAINGLQLGPNHHYTLDMMAPLLAEKWQTFKKGALFHQTPVKKSDLFGNAKPTILLNSQDRNLLTFFLEQWEHPMALYFRQQGKQAAASLDQICHLRNIAVHGDSFLYEWQYDVLHQLIIGQTQRIGLFRQIYAG